MKKSEIMEFALHTVEKSEAAYFTTVKNEVPYTRALENYRNEELFPELAKMFVGHQDDLMVYFGTNTSSEKINHIRKNPTVSVYYCKPREHHGVMLGGQIEIVTDKKIKEEMWLEGWERYYPKGVNDPDYTVLRMIPRHVRGWTGKGTFALDLD